MKKIKIMISSRCKTKIKGGNGKVELSEIRKQLKNEFEAFELFGHKIFDVWISEGPDAADMTDNSWEECMRNVEDSNIFIVLYTGEGGWAKSINDIGICHAELETAYNSEPAKCFLLNIQEAVADPKLVTNDKVNTNFQDYIKNINRFYAVANDKDTIIEKSKEIIVSALCKLVNLSKMETRKGKYNSGIALDWSRMNYSKRKEKIEETILNQLDPSRNSYSKENIAIHSIKTEEILFCCSGIPDSIGTPAARELVGQPFLNDYKLIKDVDEKISGPIHIIGVHKTVTEKQAINMLGVPDVISVKASFGIYIVDRIQKIQIVFLENCRDETSTKHNVQRFLSWISETGEDSNIIKRAKDRRLIANLILKVNP